MKMVVETREEQSLEIQKIICTGINFNFWDSTDFDKYQLNKYKLYMV